MKFKTVAALVALSLVLTGCSDFMNGKPLGARSGPPWNGHDLDCKDIQAKVWVGNNDPHNLDADGDGWGCESYG